MAPMALKDRDHAGLYAAYKRNADIAVGNVVGSNIFNIFFVLGISAVIKPLPVQPGSSLDIGMVVLSSLILRRTAGRFNSFGEHFNVAPGISGLTHEGR